jgi:ribosomal protein S18 acetylase RimI-like enzyme
MNDSTKTKPLMPSPTVSRLEEFTAGELNDLCDATYAGIEAGGGFGWVTKPPRDVLERYWQGVVTMPARILIVARLDGVICGSCQLVKPPMNNEAQKFAANLTTHFIAPWARGHGLSKMLIMKAEDVALEENFSVINLDVRETMEVAIKLYEDAGYERFGEHPNYAQVEGKMLKGFYYTKKLR